MQKIAKGCIRNREHKISSNVDYRCYAYIDAIIKFFIVHRSYYYNYYYYYMDERYGRRKKIIEKNIYSR